MFVHGLWYSSGARLFLRLVLTPPLSRLLIRPSRHNSRFSDVSVRVRVVGSAHSPCGQRLRCCDRSAQTAGPMPHPSPLAFPAAAAARRRCSLPHVSTAERVASSSWWHCNLNGPSIDSLKSHTKEGNCASSALDSSVPGVADFWRVGSPAFTDILQSVGDRDS